MCVLAPALSTSSWDSGDFATMSTEGVWISDAIVYSREEASEPSPDVAPSTPATPAFEMLFRLVAEPAYGYALRLTRNRADAEDLLQETAFNALRSFGSFEPGSNFKAWFFRILVRNFWGRHRRAQRRPCTVAFDDLPDLYLYSQSGEVGLPTTGADPAAELIDRLGTERVNQALDALPAEYRVVSTLYFMQDFTYQQIAEVLEIPVGTVRSRLHRGRKMLQQALWQVARDAGIGRPPEAEE
jgi:RNA polymerase sigma-70 factor (ECF subfamily)